ncbi:MAG: glycosyltransferase, partial [Pseudolabrys sp.]
MAVICVLVWVYLIVGRGAFWLGRVRDTGRELPELQQWPAVVAVIPARNESECIAASVTSLLRQEYSGPFSIVVVDDDSSDGTGAAATHAAEAVSHRQLTVVNSKGPPAGWTGKLWA